MPVYDYECQNGHITEHIAGINETILPCPVCQGQATRIISVSGPNLNNDDAPWIKSVLEVVDKEGGAHCQEFLRNPTRRNYRAWMQKEGIRPMEPGERPIKREPVDLSRVHREVWERHRQRKAIELRS